MKRFALMAVLALALTSLLASESQARPWWWARPVVVAPAYPAYYGSAYYVPPVYPTRAYYYGDAYYVPPAYYSAPVYSSYYAPTPWYTTYPTRSYSYYYGAPYGAYYVR